MINKKSSSRIFFVWLAAAAGVFLFGCKGDKEIIPSVIKVESGDAQVGLSGETAEHPVVLGVFSPIHSDRREPVNGIRVKIEPLGSHSGTVEGDLQTTDYSGEIRCRVRIGPEVGDQYFKAYCPDYKNVQPVCFRVVSGVKIIGNMQQVFAGDELNKPIQVIVKDANGPRKGVPVFFTLRSGSAQAKLNAGMVRTDENGVSELMLRTAGDYTGKYDISVEIGNTELSGNYPYRGIYLTVMAMSRLNLAIAVLGGLALFIFGMSLMSEGLQLIAGNRLKSMLQMFTANRLSAVLAGLGITALIQSSSACTVMVVGFVNAGLLTLHQAIGVIFGSAIGTTVTAQMVSFKLDALALPAVCVGVVVMLMAKQSRTKGISYTILGFGILFYGMMLMSQELKIISDFPGFMALFHYFDCTPAPGEILPIKPVLGAIIVGTILTIVVQSSSATVGLTIALAQSGLLNFYTAVPLILGDNIGTTITGLLASINTNRTARQAAVAATIFKVLGVAVMLVFLYIPWNGVPCFLHFVDLTTAGNVFALQPENIGRHLASAHTLFNIFNVCLFLPFVPLMARICRLIIPDASKDGEKDKICYLEEHLLNTPTVAFDQVLNSLLHMTQVSLSQCEKAVKAFLACDSSISEELNRVEAKIDNSQRDIINYLVELTRRNLSEEQSASVPVVMHCVNDAERIGDRAINIFDLIPSLEGLEGGFSESAINEIKAIGQHLQESGQMLLEGMVLNNQAVIDKVIKRLGMISQMVAHFEVNHESRLNQSDCTVEKGVVYVEILSNIERIAAHLSNLAERSRIMLAHKMCFNRNPLKKEN